MLSLNQQPEHTSPHRSHLAVLTCTGTCRSKNGLPTGLSKNQSCHYGLVKTQFDTWMKRAVEEKVVAESKPVMLSLNQQPEHTSPQKQEPSGSSDLYGHFIQSLQERLANGSLKQSELESHYGLVKRQFDAWMKRAIEEKVVNKELRPVRFELPDCTSSKEEQLSFPI